MNDPTRKYMYERLQETADQQQMTVYCIHCPKWKATGTAGTARAASEAHRAKKHPELLEVRKGKRIVRKRSGFSSTLTEEREAEIAEERRQRMRALGIG